MKKPIKKSPTTYAFIDASNLFYGGAKSLGWNIDYQKLAKYLKAKFSVARILYYAGIELDGMKFDITQGKPINLNDLILHISSKITLTQQDKYKKIQRIKFYQKLATFGFELITKPVKIYKNGNSVIKKANCDVDLTFDLMRLQRKFSRVLILSGDGDFFTVLNYLKNEKNKDILIMSRGERTAREIRQLAGSNFLDFHYLREILKFEQKKRHPSRIPLTSSKKILSKTNKKSRK